MGVQRPRRGADLPGRRDRTVLMTPLREITVPGDGQATHHAPWARVLSLGLHAAVLACLLTLPPASGGNGLVPGLVVELIPMAVAAPPEPAPPPPEPAPPPPEPAKPEPAKSEPAKPKAIEAPATPVAVRKAAATSPVREPQTQTQTQTQAPTQPVMSEPTPPSPEPSAQGAPGMGAGPAARVADVQDYSAMVWGRIMRFKPERARYPGKVTVHFTVAGDGNLVSAEVSEPSGIPALDQLALDVVRRATPFPAPPAGADAPMVFNIPFQFR